MRKKSKIRYIRGRRRWYVVKPQIVERRRRVSNFEKYHNHSSFKFLFKRKVKRMRRNLFETQKINRFNNSTNCFMVVVRENCELQRYHLQRLRLTLQWIAKNIENRGLTFTLYGNFVWPKTSKPGIRMGTGKGRVSRWTAFYRRGDKFLTIDACYEIAIKRKLFKCLFNQIPVKFKIIRNLV